VFSSHSSVPKISIDDLDNSSYNQKCQSAQIVTHQQLGEVSSMKSDARSVNIDDDDFDNMDKKVDQIIQLTHPDNMIGKSNSKGGSKRRLYHLRQDVITKTIFRALRKYYLKKFGGFKSLAERTQLKTNKHTSVGVKIHQSDDSGVKHEQMLLSQAEKFLTNVIDEETPVKTIVSKNIFELIYWSTKEFVDIFLFWVGLSLFIASIN